MSISAMETIGQLVDKATEGVRSIQEDYRAMGLKIQRLNETLVDLHKESMDGKNRGSQLRQ